MDKASFKLHLDKQTYDKYYQDIEYIDFKGYSKSSQTWEHIKDLVNWKTLKVIDVGCFHGYFSFKAFKEGAKVSGLDIWTQVIEIDEILNEKYNANVRFYHWKAGEYIHEPYDLALFLNVLHHFPDAEKVISNDIKCKKAIFEVNKIQKEMIEKHYTIEKEVESHRIGRTILLGNRK